jgi:hypothetical protein
VERLVDVLNGVDQDAERFAPARRCGFRIEQRLARIADRPDDVRRLGQAEPGRVGRLQDLYVVPLAPA